jgi:hypothetical protein
MSKRKIMIKPKQLRIAGSYLLCFAVLFVVCLYSFNTFIAPFESQTTLLFLIIALLNILQATLLFIWADVLGSHKLTMPPQQKEKAPAIDGEAISSDAQSG